MLDRVEARPIVVMGFSMGAAVALQAAADDRRIDAVVAVSPFSDLRTIVEERAPFFATRRDIARAFKLAEAAGQVPRRRGQPAGRGRPHHGALADHSRRARPQDPARSLAADLRGAPGAQRAHPGPEPRSPASRDRRRVARDRRLARRGAATSGGAVDGLPAEAIRAYRYGGPSMRKPVIYDRDATHLGSKLAVARGRAAPVDGRQSSLSGRERGVVGPLMESSAGDRAAAPVRDRPRLLRLENAHRDLVRPGVRGPVRRADRRQHRCSIGGRLHRVRGLAVRHATRGRHGPHPAVAPWEPR